MERPLLVAKARGAHGTRPARRMRHAGFIPGVVYGKKTAPIAVMVSQRDLAKFLHARAGEHGLVTLRVESDLPATMPARPEQREAGGSKGQAGASLASPTGKGSASAKASSAKGGPGTKPSDKSWEKPVLIKRLQQDPVDGAIVHIDFHAIALTEQIRVKVPLIFKGEPIGVKQDRGVLEHFLREIEVECLPTQIPKEIEHDVSPLKIGDTIHVRELTPPTGTRITADPQSVIASVLAPKEEKLEEVAAEAVTEPEVIREKKPEAEEAAATEKIEKGEKKEDVKKEEKKDK